MTVAGQSCPDALQLHTSNSLQLCGKKTGRSCDSIKINIGGKSYQQVRGTVKAYTSMEQQMVFLDGLRAAQLVVVTTLRVHM